MAVAAVVLTFRPAIGMTKAVARQWVRQRREAPGRGKGKGKGCSEACEACEGLRGFRWRPT